MGDANEDDDLEYHIKFPSAGESIYDGCKEPVVFLLGWGGCLDKYLVKYSALYEERGCITIRHTTSIEATMFYPEHVKKIAARLLDLIDDLSLEDNPLLFHIFSNNGASTYYFMSHLIQTQKNHLIPQIRGCIFDSCPSPRRFSTSVRAATKLYPHTSQIALYAFLMLRDLWNVWSWVWWYLGQGNSPVVPQEALGDEALVHPQLFLYSKNDDLVPYADVEAFVSIRRKKGVEVSEKCWEDSGHVQHLRVHPEEYTDQVHSFMQCVLKD